MECCLKSARMAEILLATPSDGAARPLAKVQAFGWIKSAMRWEKVFFADEDFEEDDLVLREPMLVGAQHEHNKEDALVCSFCFRYVGSLELQIGRRLVSRVDNIPCGHGSESASDGEEGSAGAHQEHNDGASCACDDELGKREPISKELLDALLSGDLHLPHSERFPLPPITKCHGGCLDNIYCSDVCADKAWQSYHSLLCTGEYSLCNQKAHLIEFQKHARETNDIFLVAAQVIAGTILRARQLKDPLGKTCDKNKEVQNDTPYFIREAWEPFAMGYKKLWWEAVARPEDVDPSEEHAFREQLKGLARQSCALLRDALSDEDCASLFDLNVYGHIIGMFELNNLEIVVPSPVEDYFIYIDELPSDERTSASQITRPFLDALGADYATYCTGTGFFALQSCVNHSCRPNAKAFKRDEDKDGAAILLALTSIRKGQEITISYIDENHDLEERQTLLADYGFVCSCARCVEESAAKVFSSRTLVDMIHP